MESHVQIHRPGHLSSPLERGLNPGACLYKSPSSSVYPLLIRINRLYIDSVTSTGVFVSRQMTSVFRPRSRPSPRKTFAEPFTYASVRSDAPIFSYTARHSGFRRVAGLTLLTGAPLMICSISAQHPRSLCIAARTAPERGPSQSHRNTRLRWGRG